jgi:tight adherence protein C
MHTTLLIVSLALGFGTLALGFMLWWSLSRLTQVIPKEDRGYLDPLPRQLRALWPVVKFIDHHFGSFFPKRLLNSTQEMLRITGMLFLMNARQFIALRLLSALLFCLLVAALMLPLAARSWWPMLAGTLLGFYYPRIWLRDVRKKTVDAVVRHLPVFLDFLTMSVEAGLNITGAMQHAVAKGPEGPLRREFEHVLRDLKSGLNRADALRRMDDRLRMKEVTNFVGAVIQSERMGSGLASTLRFQSEQRRSERFQRAEKQAMEAPVKLIFPLVVFIFPVTFIVLGFPIVMKFIQEGLL